MQEINYQGNLCKFTQIAQLESCLNIDKELTKCWIGYKKVQNFGY